MQTKFDEILETWKEAVKAERNHAELGKALQARGLALLESIPVSGNKITVDSATARELIQLTSNSSSMISNGVRIESAARRQLIELTKNKPEKEIL